MTHEKKLEIFARCKVQYKLYLYSEDISPCFSYGFFGCERDTMTTATHRENISLGWLSDLLTFQRLSPLSLWWEDGSMTDVLLATS